MVVELCGLPGCGKTTIASALAEQLRSQGIDAFVAGSQVSASAPLLPRLFHKALSVMAVLSASPSAESRAARALVPGQSSARDSIAVPVLWWTRKRVLARSRRSGGLAVLDEGLVQALWSAGLRSPGTLPSTLVELAESAVRPDVVVHVDRLAVDRLTARRSKHSRVQRLAVKDQLPALQQGDVFLSETLSEWRRRNLSDVVVIDGAASDCVTQLAAALLSHRQFQTPWSA
jgi:hypothetical protein